MNGFLLDTNVVSETTKPEPASQVAAFLDHFIPSKNRLVHHRVFPAVTGGNDGHLALHDRG